jgi:PadR family transcriptional regulator PadR
MTKSLGEFEQSILFALVQLEDDAYGASIGRTIERRTGRLVSAGAIYTALDRLEARGLVESRVGDPTGKRGGRRRKHYELTAAGAMSLSDTVERMRAMSEGLIPKLEALTGGRR